MTIEEIMTKMEEFRVSAEENVRKYNENAQEGNLKEANKAMEDIKDNIKDYTGLAQQKCFIECCAVDNPLAIMLEAVRRLKFETIAVKLTKPEEGSAISVEIASIVPTEKPIDLVKLNKYHEGGIGVDAKWPYMVEKLGCLLAARQGMKLGIKDLKTINDSYFMSTVAKELDMGKTPTSNTQLLNVLQSVISAMVGTEYKASSHDVEFLKAVFTKKDSKRALVVACSKNKALVSYMAEICHKLLLKKAYGLSVRVTNGNGSAEAIVE